ncbi:MAG: hypothetical protein GF331_09685 [Chitinivibrionales bacterium]|nr:hypothetical protein [Chitinivibrionales bacterium]
MKVWESPEQFHSERRSVVTVGNFDGVHTGHRVLIHEVVHRARDQGFCSIVVTFEPHTRTVLNPSSPQPIMSTFEEKVVLLERLGVDHVVRIAFDDSFRRLTAAQFVERVIAGQLHAAEWVMGTGHTFGCDRVSPQNSLHELMSRNDISAFTVKLLTDSQSVVSSTGIRGAIDKGEIARAVMMLGHPYLIAAPRVHGQGLGTKLGFPTLNFAEPPPHKVLPPPGVYAAQVQAGSTFTQGALYFGACPTFGCREAHFELHLLEDAREVPSMGETGLLWLHRHIREDRKFADSDELVAQIRKDVQSIQRFFSEEK